MGLARIGGAEAGSSFDEAEVKGFLSLDQKLSAAAIREGRL